MKTVPVKMYTASKEILDNFIEKSQKEGRPINRQQIIHIAIKDFVNKYSKEEIKI